MVCDALLNANLIAYAWLSASSSFAGSKDFYKSNRWSLAQNSKIDQDWQGLSIDTNEAKPDFGAFSVAADPDVAVLALAGGAPVGPGARFTVRQGRRYRATLTLFGLEQFAGNDMVAARLAGLGFKNVQVTGSGKTRQAEATWPGPDQTAELDSHIVDVTEVA